MARTKSTGSNWNAPITSVGFVIYGALLVLFGWQTWMFVNFLFPDDQLSMKVLTFISFDIMALVWAVVHTFYRFASRGAKQWVLISWAVTFLLSLVASVLYLVVQSFFRFEVVISPDMVNTGYAISLVALVFNVLALMSWLVLEYRVRHPRQDEFHLYDADEEDYADEGDEEPPLVYEQPRRCQSDRALAAASAPHNKNRVVRAWDAVRGKDEQSVTVAQTASASELDYDKLAAALDARKQPPQSPLAMTPVDTKIEASQTGKNGNGNHQHQ